MSDRAEPVLATALERLIENGTLTREQADAVRTGFRTDLSRTDRTDESEGNSWTPVLAEVGGYVGAAFVVAAAFALVGPNWDRFSEAGRVALLGGPAALLLLAAVVLAVVRPGSWSLPVRPGRTARPDPADHHASAPVRRLIGVLVLAGGGLLAAATAVLIEDSHSYQWIPVVPLFVWGTGYLLVRGAPLHVGTAVALFWTVETVFDPDYDQQFPLTGVLLVVAAVGWLLLALYQVVEEQVLAIAVAGVMAFTGGEIAAFSDYEGLGYLLLGLLALAGLLGYVRTRALSALGVGAVSLAVVVPQVVIDYTEGSLGTAGGLLVSGLSIVAASVLATRLRRSTSGPTQLV